MPDSRADFLLADLGNTFSKFQLADARRGRLFGPRRQLLTAALGPAALIALLGRWRYRRVALCSVVPAAAEILYDTLAEPVLTLRPGLRRTPEQLAGVDLSLYPRRKTLGPDRLANLAGALARHGPGPMLVVSLGTAATFDALDAHGRFLGGVIAPGPDALANALHHRTALLPLLAFPHHAYAAHPPPALGLSTRGALRSAAFHGWRGMVREILHALCREHAGRLGPSCPDDLKVIATGGVAPRLALDVPELRTVDPDLTFVGLRALAVAGGLSARRPQRRPAARPEPSEPAAPATPVRDDNTLPLAGLAD